MTVWICDWTHWQGVPCPAETIEAEGFEMVKLKAGGAKKEGRHFEDPTFFQSAANLLRRPRLVPAAYWYLMPGRPSAQAGQLYDMIRKAGDAHRWAAFLDLEEPGVTYEDYTEFSDAWESLTDGKVLNCYTSKRYWEQNYGARNGSTYCFVVEDAHWVPEAVRKNPNTPYASQQAKAIPESWWEVSYGGWENPDMIQFTDYALVAGKRTTASLYRGTKEQLIALTV